MVCQNKYHLIHASNYRIRFNQGFSEKSIVVEAVSAFKNSKLSRQKSYGNVKFSFIFSYFNFLCISWINMTCVKEGENNYPVINCLSIGCEKLVTVWVPIANLW